ncbi:MAG: hypothetical protein ABT19_09925 [Rhodanobacter sp. SCN 68-63]|nr:MAG: hypothetical protein ABT19_09925 [Rhodanobacter sp. SCN 68-63]
MVVAVRDTTYSTEGAAVVRHRVADAIVDRARSTTHPAEMRFVQALELVFADRADRKYTRYEVKRCSRCMRLVVAISRSELGTCGVQAGAQIGIFSCI